MLAAGEAWQTISAALRGRYPGMAGGLITQLRQRLTTEWRRIQDRINRNEQRGRIDPSEMTRRPGQIERYNYRWQATFRDPATGQTRRVNVLVRSPTNLTLAQQRESAANAALQVANRMVGNSPSLAWMRVTPPHLVFVRAFLRE